MRVIFRFSYRVVPSDLKYDDRVDRIAAASNRVTVMSRIIHDPLTVTENAVDAPSV